MAAIVLLALVFLATFHSASCQVRCYASTDCRGGMVEVFAPRMQDDRRHGDCCGGRGLSFADSGIPCQNCFREEAFTGPGNEFFLAFFNNRRFLAEGVRGRSSIRISVGAMEDNVEFVVDTERETRTLTTGTSPEPTVVSLTDESLRLEDSGDRDGAVVIKSMDGRGLSVIALAEDLQSSDSFKSLPTVFLPDFQFEYYIVSVPNSLEEDFLENAQGAFAIIPSEEATITLQVTADVDISETDDLADLPEILQAGTSVTFTLGQMQTLYISASGVDSTGDIPSDLTGSRILSDKPLSVIMGHECANVPNERDFCDQLAEQVPPTTTWGMRFFTVPFAGRTAFDMFRVVAAKNNTNFTGRCTSENPGREGTQNFQFSLQKGEWEEFMISFELFCCFESTKPVLLVQFSIASTADNMTFADPFMVTVPPVEQYQNNYLIDTLSSTRDVRETSYINIFVPLPYDRSGVLLDGQPLPESEVSQWIEIFCTDGESTCAYGRQVEVAAGAHILNHSNPEARLNAIVYWFSFRVAHGYFAGMTQRPITLPTVTLESDSQDVFKNATSITFTLTRTGDLRQTSTVFILTRDLEIEEANRTARAGTDYTALNSTVVFQPGEQTQLVQVGIIDDVFSEENKTFEVFLAASPGVYLNPFAYTVVRILNGPAICYASTDCRGGVVKVFASRMQDDRRHGDCCGGRGLSFADNGIPCQNCFREEAFTGPGNEFFLAFFNNRRFLAAGVRGGSSIRISVGAMEDNVEFVVDTERETLMLTTGTSPEPTVVTLTDESLRLEDSGDRDGAVLVKSTDGRGLSVIALAEDLQSSDSFKSLPTVFLPDFQYEYYVVSVPNSLEEDFLENAQGAFAIIPSEDATITLQVTTDVDISETEDLADLPEILQAGTSVTISLGRMQTLYISASGVDSTREIIPSDLTGSRILSDKPLSVITGHECGNVPNERDFCDQLAEQVPPTTTWGMRFITAPFAGRTAFDMFRVVAARHNTNFTGRCTSENSGREGAQNFQFSLQKGEWEEFMISFELFCYFNSTEPVLLVQFSIASTTDNMTFADPFMAIIPPVEQYQNNYLIDTLSSTLDVRETSYINIFVPLPYDRSGVLLDGQPIPESEVSQWIEIFCTNGESTCAYGRQVEVAAGAHILNHSNPEARLNAIVYWFSFRVGHGYFAGMTQRPITLSTVTLESDSEDVFENATSITFTLTRTGDLRQTSTVFILTGDLEIEEANRTARAGTDYTALNSTVVFQPGERTQLVQVEIIDDIFPEENKTFEVFLAASPRVYLNPFAYTVVRILNDDPPLPVMNVSFVSSSIMVREGMGIVEFVLQKTEGAVGDVSVLVTTMDGTANGGEDYDPIEEIVTFGVEDLEARVTTLIFDNLVLEERESFTAEIFPVQGLFPVAVLNSTATVLIEDNDIVVIGFMPVVYSVEEGGSVSLMVVLQFGTLARNVTINVITVDGSATATAFIFIGVITVDGSATASSDYVAVSRSVLFTPSTQSWTVTVPLLDDSRVESSEGFTVRLELEDPQDGNIVVLLPNEANVTITDNDRVQVTFIPEEYTVNEGEQATIHIEKLTSSDIPVSVTFFTMHGDAQESTDYEPRSGVVITFQSSVTEQFIVVNTTDNAVYELTETFFCRLQNNSATVDVVQDTATVFIIDQDEVVIELDPASYTVNEGGQTQVRVITRGDFAVPISVSLSTRDRTARAGSDYTSIVSQTIAFQPGQTEQFVTVEALTDTLFEGTETFEAILSNPSAGVRLGQDTANVTILESGEVLVEFDPTSYTVNEAAGVVSLRVVKRTPSTQTVTVLFNTRHDTARDPDHGVQTDTPVAFGPGDTEQLVNVAISDDNVTEITEMFFGELILPQGSTGVRIGQGQAEVFIEDNDRVLVELNPIDYEVGEDARSIRVRIVKRGESEVDITIHIFTTDGSATAGEDYVGISQAIPRLITFPPGGDDLAFIDILILNDTIAENIEDFGGNLRIPVGETNVDLGTSFAFIEIDDNDVVRVEIEFPMYTVPENNGSVFVCLTTNTGISEPLMIIVTASQKDTISATDGADFTNATQTVTFQPSPDGSRVCTTIDILDDSIALEGNESFTISMTLLPGSIATAGQPSWVIIIDDDEVEVEFERPTYTVTEEGGSVEVCLVTNTEIAESFAVDVTAQEKSHPEATANEDFEPDTDQVTFTPAGGNRACTTFEILDDAIALEGDERFSAVFSLPGTPGILEGSITEACIIITDMDEVVVEFDPDSYTVNEGRAIQVRVVARDGFTFPVSVSLSTRDGTATAGSDYTSIVSQTITFQPGQTEQFVTVEALTDTLFEGTETFEAILSNPSVGVRLGQDTANVTISAVADVLVEFDPTSYTVNEAAGVVSLRVVKRTPSTQTVTVLFNTRPDTARGLDYGAQTATPVTFGPDDTQQSVNIAVIDDTVAEITERFFGELILPQGSTGMRIGQGQAEVFIENNDIAELGFTRGSLGVLESDGTASVTVQLQTEVERTITVRLFTQDDHATAPTDYTAVQRVLTFDSSTTSATVPIEIVNDDFIEADERFFVRLELVPGQSGVVISRRRTRVIIETDDECPELGATISEKPLVTTDPLAIQCVNVCYPRLRRMKICPNRVGTGV